MSILEEIYYGTYRPCEQIKPDSKEYEQINNRIHTMLEALQHRMTEVDYQLLQDMFDLYDEVTSLYTASAYAHGFKAGIQMWNEMNNK
ncbi:DUF6809 family protein [Paenibacillus sp. WLX1005]|uniref:DUF6809 family protein n=1 Tax=Paenibacillus sp. WLX1005 TaxID=3243766 RepID=UPI003983DCAA